MTDTDDMCPPEEFQVLHGKYTDTQPQRYNETQPREKRKKGFLSGVSPPPISSRLSSFPQSTTAFAPLLQIVIFSRDLLMKKTQLHQKHSSWEEENISFQC